MNETGSPVSWGNLSQSPVHCSDPEYYNSLYGLVGTLCQASVFLVGVTGNVA